MLQSLNLLFFLSLAAPPGLQAYTEAQPSEVAQALQKKYETIRDFSAEFTHSYVGGVLRQQVTERGTVLIKKPGRMKWTYSSPDYKLFVSDGYKLYSYIPQDKQVIVSSVPTEDEASTPVLFLAGKGNLARDFTASFTELAGAPESAYVLKLVPRKPEREYDWLVLVVDRDSLRLRMLATSDVQGGRSTFTFNNLRENVGLSDKEFTFKIPRGVDVVSGGPKSQ